LVTGLRQWVTMGGASGVTDRGVIGPTLAYVPLPVATAVPIVRSDLPVRILLPLQPKGLRVDPRLAEDVCAG